MHPLQSPKWGQFRKKTGIKVVNINNLQLTIHPIPFVNYTIGYLPKGPMPNRQMLIDLEKIGKEEKCIFIQIEPNIETANSLKLKIKKLGLVTSAHPLFTKYNFILDLTKSEDELLKNMNQKTRYNIRLAEKRGVKIIEDNSDKAFEEYLKLTKETTKRQKFYAHSQSYHKLMWETLRQLPPKADRQGKPINFEELSAHLLKAIYKDETLVTWILFILEDVIYYPYGASSTKYRDVMASNLMMWEAIRFSKKLDLKKFDMWGALGPNPDKNDSWYGFHKFKEGYGAKLVEYVGDYDFIINKNLYLFYKIINKFRWLILKLK